MKKHISIILAGLSVALIACAPQNSLEAHSEVGVTPNLTDYKDAPTESPPTTGDGTGAPVPADPPPITLGSYPWIMITSYERSEDGKTLHIKGLVLDEDDPPGIPVFSGFIKNTDKDNPDKKLKIPITVVNRFTGEVTFSMPASWANSSKTHGVLSGPGYTEAEFEVCDLEEN